MLGLWGKRKRHFFISYVFRTVDGSVGFGNASISTGRAVSAETFHSIAEDLKQRDQSCKMLMLLSIFEVDC